MKLGSMLVVLLGTKLKPFELKQRFTEKSGSVFYQTKTSTEKSRTWNAVLSPTPQLHCSVIQLEQKCRGRCWRMCGRGHFLFQFKHIQYATSLCKSLSPPPQVNDRDADDQSIGLDFYQNFNFLPARISYIMVAGSLSILSLFVRL